MNQDSNQFHKYPVNYGVTNGMNLSGMPDGQYFCVGYNDEGNVGFVDVLEGHGSDGTPIYEGKVDLGGALAELPKRTEANARQVDDSIESVIMDDYNARFGLN